MADCFSPGFLPVDPSENVPMDPEDYVALLVWVKAKEAGKRIGIHHGYDR